MSGVETRTRAARIFGFLDLLSRITCRILRELVQYLIVFVDIYNAIQVLGRASRNVHQERKKHELLKVGGCQPARFHLKPCHCVGCAMRSYPGR